MSEQEAQGGAQSATFESRVQRLEDESAIRRLVARFARHLDERGWGEYASLYAADASLVLPHGHVSGRDAIQEFVAGDLGRYLRTHHAGGLQDIEVDGDEAIVRATLLGVHVTSGDGREFWAGGGWYELHLRRTGDAWLLTSVAARPIWLAEHGSSPRPDVDGETPAL